MLTKFHLNGKTINLTSDNTVIKSTNFSVDKNGNITASNINITGGQISLKSDETTSMLEVINKSNSNYFTRIFPRTVICKSGENNISVSATLGYGMIAMNTEGVSTVGITGSSTNPRIFLQTSLGTVFNADKDGVSAKTFNNSSIESIKKNITKFEDALEIIKNSEIYEYNFKTEEDTEQKHIGFIIGDITDNKYKTPQRVLSKDKKAIENYSMASINWKATQQILELIERIEKRITLLEEK